jgi:hypothetical protein
MLVTLYNFQAISFLAVTILLLLLLLLLLFLFEGVYSEIYEIGILCIFLFHV